MNRTMQWTVAAAAVAAAFALGWGLGGNRGTAPKETAMTEATPAAVSTASSAAATTAQFAFLLLEDDRYEVPTGDEAMSARVSEYGNWARSLAESGRFVDGAKLSDDGRLLRRGADGAPSDVSDGVARGQLGVLAGYFLVGADSYEEALRIAGECPHVKYGGTVEVRRIDS